MVSKGSQGKANIELYEGFQGSVSLLRALSFLYTRTVLASSTALTACLVVMRLLARIPSVNWAFLSSPVLCH